MIKNVSISPDHTGSLLSIHFESGCKLIVTVFPEPGKPLDPDAVIKEILGHVSNATFSDLQAAAPHIFGKAAR